MASKSPKTKVCSKCGVRRKIEKFSYENKKKGTRRNCCKKCRKDYLAELAKRPKESVECKVCRTCENEQPSENFPKDSRSRDGLSYRCKDCHKTESKRYRNSKKGKETRRRCNRVHRRRVAATPEGRLRKGVSRDIREALNSKGACKGGTSVWKALPYTPQELVKWLEEQFTEGMSWDNYGEWHIDHVVAHSHFHYTSLEHREFRLCWSLDNLQPMWAHDNMAKGSMSMREFEERKRNGQK